MIPERQCPRCESDTCPGRDMVLDCTALVDGLSAEQEAVKALARVGPYMEAIDAAEDAARHRGTASIVVRRNEDGWSIAADTAADTAAAISALRPEPGQTIMVILPGALGDEHHAQAVQQGLTTAFPGVRFVLVAGPGTARLADDAARLILDLDERLTLAAQRLTQMVEMGEGSPERLGGKIEGVRLAQSSLREMLR